MSKTEIKEIKSEKEYRELKARVNKFERNWRKTHPKQHVENSKALLKAIRTPKKKAD